MEKIFALYDSDVFYATRFMEYFKKKNNSNFEVAVFTEVASLEEYLQFHYIDILILGDELSLDESFLQKIKHVYRLTKEPGAGDGLSEYCAFFKYQSASDLINEILNDFNKKEDKSKPIISSNQVNIMSVFIPVSGNAKMSFVWSLSALLSQQKKVLLVLLDLLPVPYLIPLNDSSYSLMEFIYYLKENSNIITKMKSLLSGNGNLSYLAGITHGLDILALNKEDIQKWIQELKLHSDYQTVIFCIGCYTEAMIELMNLSDTILVASTGSAYEMEVLKEWERQMSRIGTLTNSEKYQYITLKNDNSSEAIPVSYNDLTHSDSWLCAQQYLNG